MDWPKIEKSAMGALYLLEQYPHGVCYVDTHGRILEVNAQFCALTGRSRKPLLDRELRELFDDAHRARFDSAFRGAVDSGYSVVQLMLVIQGGGDYLDVEVTLLPLVTEDGIEGIYCIVEDVSEQRRAAVALRKSEERYRKILETAQEGVSISDENSVTTYVNPALEAMLGYDRRELVGKSAYDVIAPEFRDKALEYRRRRQSGMPERYESCLLRADGNRIWVIASASPIVEEDGRISGFVSMLSDITERKQMEEALAESEQRYRRIIETAQEGIWMIDENAVTTFVNPAVEAMSGYTAEELIGQPVTAFAHPARREEMRKRLEHRNRGVSERYEMEMMTADGSSFWVMISGTPLRAADGRVTGAIGMLTNIDELKRTQNDLEQKSRDLAERIKELSCIRRVIEILEKSDYPETGVLQEVVDVLPAGWQYPDITAARIEVNGREVSTGNYRETAWKMLEPIQVWDKPAGFIHVVYLEECPDEDEGPFLKEERELLGIIAGKVRQWYELREVTQQLHLAAKAIESTAEGVMILDREGRPVMVNPAYLKLSGYREEDLLGRVMKNDPTSRQGKVADWLRLVDEGGEALGGESWFERRDGTRIPVLASIAPIRDQQGRTTHYVILERDISEQKEFQQRLDYLSVHDELTGLPNRAALLDRGTRCIDQVRRSDMGLAVLYIDIDQFKYINDSMGHGAGDEFLIKLGERLQRSVRTGDMVVRIATDEFGVLLDRLKEPSGASVAAAKIQEVARAPILVQGREVAVTVSMGIALFPGDGSDFETLVRNAELALFNAKQQGRANYQFYTKEMNRAGERALTLRTALHKAIEREEFRLHYQPIVDVPSGRITGMEALIRWYSEELGMVPPSDFIPLAEETGLIFEIGEWVLCEAVRETAALVRDGYEGLRVAVNLSARQFQEPQLAQRVSDSLEREGLAASSLELEITETMMMHSVWHAAATLKDLHRLGVTVALDDFGTGYSSLQYLKDFPIEHLKIDKSFVDGLPQSSRSAAVVRTIIGMARGLGINVIAEGVETGDQLVFLRELGCHEAQGYLLSMPLPAEDLRWLLENYKTLPVPEAGSGNVI